MNLKRYFRISSLVALCIASWCTALATDDHLLLSEAVVTPTSNEFIEIANPTNTAISLDNYYLSDDEDYALLPGAFGAGPAPSIDASFDFIAQFPNGASVPAGGVIVIAFDGAGFTAAYGFAADFEILATDAATPDMIATDVGSSAGLTNSGESLVLFFWDGASDLVQDVDMVNVGTPSTSNDLGDKTGVTVDGPDGDTVASAYAPDASTIPQQLSDPGFGVSTKRIAPEAGNEVNGGGNGISGDDETTEQIGTTWDSVYTAPSPGVAEFLTPSLPMIVINEIDADTAGTETEEFIELYDGGAGNTALDGLAVVLFNGSDDQSYTPAFDLDGLTTDGDGFFLIGGTNVAGINDRVTAGTGILVTNTFWLQNGADAVAVYAGDAADFPNDSAITTDNLIDALVYDTSDGDDAALLVLVEAGQPQVNENGNGTREADAIARVPDGGTARQTDTYVAQAPTPGVSNQPVQPAPDVVINEIDSDTAGTERAEFIELYDGGTGNTALDGLAVVLFNGSDDLSYNDAFDLDGLSTDGDGYFLIAGTEVNGIDDRVAAGTGIRVTNTYWLQNGADAVALFSADASSFPNDTPITTDGLIDAIVYDTSDGDDAALLVLLNPGQPQVNENSNGNREFESCARIPNGGAARDTDTYVQQVPTPGFSNIPLADVVINEVDADNASTDTEEFIELYDGGVGNTALDGLVVVLFNGSDDQSYTPVFDLDGYTTDENGFFLIAGRNVPGINDRVPVNTGILVSNDSWLQNGADAVAVFAGDASSFPNDTPLTTVDLIDAVVYDTDDSDDAGLLPLLNPGQPQVNERGGGSGTTQANARVPDGGIPRDTDTYVQQDPTPGTFNFIELPTIPATIAEIQGPGNVSPLEGMRVLTTGIVTAVTSNGFFMQTPDNLVDADPNSSEGLFVFSDAVVAVGDEVSAEGPVVEYFGYTELTGDSVVITVLSSGNPLPNAVVLDDMFPTGTPQTVPDLETVEGMLVQVSQGLVVDPTNRFGDFGAVAGTQRTFREPGTLFPGIPGTPVWDGNPEIFEVNPDGAGQANADVFARSTFSATGALAYSFGAYQIQPTALSITPAQPLVAVRDRQVGEMTIASVNMLRLFQDDPSAQGYADRLNKFSLLIRDVLGSPDIIGVQEVGTIEVLDDLAAKLAVDDPSLNYTSVLIEGNDFGGIDVGYLVGDSYQINGVSQVQPDETFLFNGNDFTLHDRPPLYLEGAYVAGGANFPVNVLVVHNRSLIELETNQFAQEKRLLQATRIADFMQAEQNADSSVRIVVTGDFNAFEFTDGVVDCVGIIAGDLDPLGALLPGADIVNPDLVIQTDNLPAEERYSFIQDGSAQALDHMLTTATLTPFVSDTQYGRANADAPDSESDNPNSPHRASDHDNPVLFLLIDSDGDGIPDENDTCPQSNLAATVIIDGCDSGVVNALLDDGCTISDLIADCAAGAGNHGQFVSCVAHLTNDLKKAGIISGKEKGSIQSCAAGSSIP